MISTEYIGIPVTAYNKNRAKSKLVYITSLGLALALAITSSLLVRQIRENKALEEHNNELIDSIIAESIVEQEVEEPEQEITVPVSAPSQSVVDSKYIGEYSITYYCPCEKCCGKYGANRPKVNNKPVVTTSTGAFAQEGITVAVDPKVIPYGTLLYIEGVGYRIAQDCGGAIKGNRIDVYMSSHEEAIQAGRHESKIYIITTGGTKDE